MGTDMVIKPSRKILEGLKIPTDLGLIPGFTGGRLLIISNFCSLR